jgi:hypothetical protein
MAWLAIYGLFWLIGFAIQSFGEKWKLLKYYPTKHFSNDSQFFEFRARFLLKAGEHEKSQLERFVVIKESCGNGYVSLAASMLLLIIFSAVYLVSDSTAAFSDIIRTYKFHVITFIVVSVVVYYLRQMHLIFMNRQYEYMRPYVEMFYSDKAGKNA